MHKILYLAVLLSANNCAASAAAKLPTIPEETDTKGQGETAHKMRTGAIGVVLPQMPKELVGIIGEYAAPIDPMIEDMLSEKKRLPEILTTIYTIICSFMPPQETLERAFKAGTAQQLLRDIFYNVAVELNKQLSGLLEAAPRYNKFGRLKKKYADQWKEYSAQVRAQSLESPYGNRTMDKWKKGGFDPYSTLDHITAMRCPQCKGDVPYPFPWMQPQYYHKPACKKLRELQQQSSSYGIAKYGQAVPKNPNEYLKYTIMHLDVFSNPHVYSFPLGTREKLFWNWSWDFTTHIPAVAAFSEYVLKPIYSKELFKSVYQPLREIVVEKHCAGSQTYRPST